MSESTKVYGVLRTFLLLTAPAPLFVYHIGVRHPSFCTIEHGRKQKPAQAIH